MALPQSSNPARPTRNSGHASTSSHPDQSSPNKPEGAARACSTFGNEAQRFATVNGLSLVLDPMPNPQQLFGIETDFYAHEIASVV